MFILISYLFCHAVLSQMQAVKSLVESGANINARNRESKYHSALHEAVIGGHADVAKYLLKMGANQVILLDAVAAWRCSGAI
jgi:ankyrin repeat protein